MTSVRNDVRSRRPLRAVGAAVIGSALLVSGCGTSDGAGRATDGSSSPSEASEGDAGYGSPALLGRLQDEAVRESSGLVASRRNPGLLWTHNDAGDDAHLYCLTREAGRCGTWRVTGAEAQDWEDVATGPGPVAGERYLYLGDIGDNDETRSEVVVYRVVEPAAPAAGGDPAATAASDALRLRYEDGPHDAEALVVDPATGDLYVVTKDKKDAGVYRAAVGATVLTRIADFDLGGEEVVTGADVSPDGARVAVVTKVQAHEMSQRDGSAGFSGVWEQPRRRVALADRDQGEAIAYRLDGGALLTTSEGSPMPLHELTWSGPRGGATG